MRSPGGHDELPAGPRQATGDDEDGTQRGPRPGTRVHPPDHAHDQKQPEGGQEYRHEVLEGQREGRHRQRVVVRAMRVQGVPIAPVPGGTTLLGDGEVGRPKHVPTAPADAADSNASRTGAFASPDRPRRCALGATGFKCSFIRISFSPLRWMSPSHGSHHVRVGEPTSRQRRTLTWPRLHPYWTPQLARGHYEVSFRRRSAVEPDLEPATAVFALRRPDAVPAVRYVAVRRRPRNRASMTSPATSPTTRDRALTISRW